MRAEFTPDNHYAGLLAQAKALFRITQSQEAIISTLRSKLTELESQLAMVGTAEIEAQRAANEQLTNEVEQVDRLQDKIAGLRNDVLEEIESRDAFHEAADRLASEIARFFGVDIGEHSSANCPWDNAYEAIPTGDIESLKAEWKAEALEEVASSVLADDPYKGEGADITANISVKALRFEAEAIRRKQRIESAKND